MRVSLSIVDLTGLPAWPSAFVAGAAIARTADPDVALRLMVGQAVAPARIQVLTLRHGLVLLSVVEPHTGAPGNNVATRDERDRS